MTDVATTRRGRQAEANGETQPDAQASTEGAQAEPAKRERKGKPIQLTVPNDLKGMIDEAAKADGNKTAARFVLETFVQAKFPDYKLPEPLRTGGGGARQPALFPKSLTADERKARMDVARRLLEKYERGEIKLDELAAQAS